MLLKKINCVLIVKKNIITILYYFWLSVNTVTAKQNIIFHQISLEQGLSQATVTSILQDSKGYIWAGTQDGLNRFDGYQFKIYRNNLHEPNSLGNNYIWAIYEDSYGTIWLASRGGGLNQFEPETDTFIRFVHDFKNPNSISDNFLTQTTEDKDGFLWIGTRNGLNRFDRETGDFIHFKNDPENPKTISSNNVLSLIEDLNGNIWAGTDNGLNLLIKNENNLSSSEFIRYQHNNQSPKGLSNNMINAIVEGQDGCLWIGTDAGLNKMTRSMDKNSPPSFIHYPHDPENPQSLSHSAIRTLLKDNEGNLWIGTHGGGLNLLEDDCETGENAFFIHYKNKTYCPNSLSNNHIMSMLEDRSGNIWLGTVGGGINRFDKKTGAFQHCQNEPDNPNSLNENQIFAILEDSRQNLWIGTYGGGINKQIIDDSPNSPAEFIHYMHNPHHSESLGSNIIRALFEDSKGNIWIGTENEGLNKNAQDSESDIFIHYKNEPGNPKSLSHNVVLAIAEDGKNRLWTGTQGGGLNLLLPEEAEKKQPAFRHFRYEPDNPESLAHDVVWALHIDALDNLWIGTFGGGLNKLVCMTEDCSEVTFTKYVHDENDPESIASNSIISIYEDSKGFLWLGTIDGLSMLNPGTQTFTTFREKDGLPNNVIYGILEDEEGYLWLSTNRGISRFNTQTFTFTNYDKKDGLQDNEFNTGAYFKGRSGKLYFGGIKGLTAFYPSQIKDNTSMPPVIFTDFLLFNKSVPISHPDSSEAFSLPRHIGYLDDIVLDYKNNMFTIEFSALNYRQPEKNKFAYKLENFNSDWLESDFKYRRATYTNIPHGEYIFRVIASNDDGYWNNEGAAVRITILPPFWKTWWFQTLAVIFILAVLFGGLILRIRSIEAQRKKLETQVYERTLELHEKNRHITEQNEHITASIRYAKTIQQAILPLKERLSSELPDHFILYKPKDIVSGDFYWFNKNQGHLFIAVVDCTGHGVPGAFMSMIGATLLNEIVNDKKIFCPAEILNHLHIEIRSALKQENGGVNTRDGMDICLCSIQPKEGRLLFAGAKRPLYIIRKTETSPEMIEIKGNRKSIGGKQREKKRVFTPHEVRLQKGDALYLTTDGFADQNNCENRKITTKLFKSWLLSFNGMPMPEQKAALSRQLLGFQGEEPQRDDITVMGFRFGA